ncbi:MAG: nucleoside-diphosphate-sugar epimerase [Candidatus Nomurabacteria bacterium]|nr:nucleoside-diphosphate-sugar epimerase [Candidatus Nomurabacteria bacterium]
MKNSKKIFVTGATGYVGRHLVQDLIKKGYTLYVLTRNDSSIFSDDPAITVITGDITGTIDLPSDVSTIYHCAGVIYDEKEMDRVNVRGTKNIAALAYKHGCNLIHLSSAGVIGSTAETVIDERTACHPGNAYEISKYKAEQVISDAVKQGLRAQILRPTSIFGPHIGVKKDSFFQLVKSMRNGLYKAVGHGMYNIVHIDEVIKALELLDNPRLPSGSIYIVNNPISYANMDVLVKNIPPVITRKTVSVSYPVAWVSAALLTVVCRMANKKNPLTFSRLRALTSRKTYSQSKIVETLSFKNAFSIETHISKTCEQYIAEGLLS